MPKKVRISLFMALVAARTTILHHLIPKTRWNQEELINIERFLLYPNIWYDIQSCTYVLIFIFLLPSCLLKILQHLFPFSHKPSILLCLSNRLWQLFDLAGQNRWWQFFDLAVTSACHCERFASNEVIEWS